MDILEKNDQIQNESVTGNSNSGEIIEESSGPQVSETEILRTGEAKLESRTDPDANRDHVSQDGEDVEQEDEENVVKAEEESASPQVSETEILRTGEAKLESRTDPDADRDHVSQDEGSGDQEAGKESVSQDNVEKLSEIKEKEKEKEDFKVDYSTLTREDLVLRLEELIENKPIQDIRTDVDNIKLNYYKKYKAEVEQLRKKYVENGGDIDDFQAPEDSLESRIKELFKRYREFKAKSNRLLEQEKLENLEKKYEVIEKIKDLINRKESINKTFQEFRELQKEWRSIGLVPQQNLKDLWDTYNHHVEKFYDYIKINKELRDLDFKKNLEAKIVLCEKAEELFME